MSNTVPHTRAYQLTNVRRILLLFILTFGLASICLFILYLNLKTSYQDILYQYDAVLDKLAKVSHKSLDVELYSQDILRENENLRNKCIEYEKEIVKLQHKINEFEKENKILSQRNDELQKENIYFQNTIKLAASVGIKPQNYTIFEGFNRNASINKGKYIGTFIGTAYTPAKDECGNNKGITNSGHPIIPGVSIAVDSRYWPMGTIFYVKGLGYVMAMDTGSAIKGKNRFDFAVLDKNFARVLGVRKWEVYLVKKGEGKLTNIKDFQNMIF